MKQPTKLYNLVYKVGNKVIEVFNMRTAYPVCVAKRNVLKSTGAYNNGTFHIIQAL